MNVHLNIFDADQFKLWLEGNKAASVAGRARDGCECPLANWVINKGYQGVEIGEISLSFELDGFQTVGVELPKWAREFVDRVDALALARNSAGMLSTYADEITYADALKVLSFILREIPKA